MILFDTETQRQQHIQLLRKIQASEAASAFAKNHDPKPNAHDSRTCEACYSDCQCMIPDTEDDVMRPRCFGGEGFINFQVDGLRSKFLDSETITIAFGDEPCDPDTM
jgi:hypothetical protein